MRSGCFRFGKNQQIDSKKELNQTERSRNSGQGDDASVPFGEIWD